MKRFSGAGRKSGERVLRESSPANERRMSSKARNTPKSWVRQFPSPLWPSDALGYSKAASSVTIADRMSKFNEALEVVQLEGLHPRTSNLGLPSGRIGNRRPPVVFDPYYRLLIVWADKMAALGWFGGQLQPLRGNLPMCASAVQVEIPPVGHQTISMTCDAHLTPIPQTADVKRLSIGAVHVESSSDTRIDTGAAPTEPPHAKSAQ
jgi:hypothetical protein